MAEEINSYGFVSELMAGSSPGSLLEGIDLLGTVAQDKWGNTSLHKAIRENKVQDLEALLSKNLHTELKNEVGETPLMLAVKLGNELLVEILIQKGANVNTIDNYQSTPLLVAVKLNFEHIVDLLLKNGASVLVNDIYFKSPLHVAIKMNFESVFDKLVEAGANVNHVASDLAITPIDVALKKGNLRIAKKLITQGASLGPPIVICCILHYYKEKFKLFLDFFLKHGFGVKGCENWSLLHLAVKRGYETAVKNLLKEGAYVNVKDRSGETPLHFAVRSSNRSIVKLLIDYKCDPNAINKKGETPLHIAVLLFSAEIVRILLNSGADMNIAQNRGKSSLDLLSKLSSRKLRNLSSRKIISYMICAIKMDLAKVPTNLVQNDGVFPRNFTTVCAFEGKCVEELNRMKAKNFGEASLRNVFSELKNPVFAGNSEMKVFLKSYTLKSDFPIYYSLLRKKFKEGYRRNSLLNNLSLSVRVVIGSKETYIVLPIEMSRRVLMCLEDCDLWNVKRAFNHKL